MYFSRVFSIKYCMRRVFAIICACLCMCALGGGTYAALSYGAEGKDTAESLTVLTLWQIDSFEGGRGSRAEYLAALGKQFSEENNTYIEVTSLTAEAARANIESGTVPDMISYGAGFYGIEGVIADKYSATAWCRGAYCLLAIGDSDFSDVTAENTVINEGKDNLAAAAALFVGVDGADYYSPTSAYLQLLNGKYKYLLGTQRDIVRLTVRGAQFSVKALTEFNDLYQYISVLATAQKGELCYNFTQYIISHSEELTDISMMMDGYRLYSSALGELEGLSFDYTVSPIVSQQTYERLKNAVNDGDINLLKTLLK